MAGHERIKKTIALILVCLLLPLAAACDKKPQPSETTNPGESTNPADLTTVSVDTSTVPSVPPTTDSGTTTTKSPATTAPPTPTPTTTPTTPQLTRDPDAQEITLKLTQRQQKLASEVGIFGIRGDRYYYVQWEDDKHIIAAAPLKGGEAEVLVEIDRSGGTKGADKMIASPVVNENFIAWIQVNTKNSSGDDGMPVVTSMTVNAYDFASRTERELYEIESARGKTFWGAPKLVADGSYTYFADEEVVKGDPDKVPETTDPITGEAIRTIIMRLDVSGNTEPTKVVSFEESVSIQDIAAYDDCLFFCIVSGAKEGIELSTQQGYMKGYCHVFFYSIANKNLIQHTNSGYHTHVHVNSKYIAANFRANSIRLIDRETGTIYPVLDSKNPIYDGLREISLNGVNFAPTLSENYLFPGDYQASGYIYSLREQALIQVLDESKIIFPEKYDFRLVAASDAAVLYVLRDNDTGQASLVVVTMEVE